LQLRRVALDLDDRLNGSRARQEPGEKFRPIINDRLFAVARGVDRSTYGPTPSHRRNLQIAQGELQEIHQLLSKAEADLTKLVQDLIAAGAPWIEGEPLPPISR
jgi:hypothetical protein